MSLDIVIAALGTICCLGVLIMFVVSSPLWRLYEIIPEYQKAVTFKKEKGKAIATGVHGPGVVFINPFTTSLRKVDIRSKDKTTEVLAVSEPDNTKIRIQTQRGYRILDPAKSAGAVASIDAAMEAIAIVSLRQVIHGMSIKTMQDEHNQLETKWRNRINDEVSERWGVEVAYTDIQKITRVPLEVE